MQPVNEYIEKAPAIQQEILKKLRKLILDAVPVAQETFKWGRPVYATTKNFCYLNYTKNHVNFGFFVNTESLADPNGKLEGTGKDMRHVKIKTVDDIDTALFEKWIVQTSKI